MKGNHGYEKIRVEIPDGQRLGLSRDTDGAYRAHLFDETNNLVGHAELFEPDEDATDSPYIQYVYVSDSTDTKSGDLTDEELEEMLKALVGLAMIVATLAAAAAPHVKSWWHDVAVPLMKSASESARLAAKSARDNAKLTVKSALNTFTGTWMRERGAAESETPDVSEPVIAGSSIEVAVAFEGYRARMGSAEARERFIGALLARAFSDEQLRLLSNAKFENDRDALDLQAAMERLTPQQVGETLSLMLEKNPSLLERDSLAELATVVRGSKTDGGYVSLKLERMKEPRLGRKRLVLDDAS